MKKRRTEGAWVTDFRHFLTEDRELFQRNGRVPPIAQFTASIVSDMSIIESGVAVKTITQCHRRPNRKACKGWIIAIKRADDSAIEWECPECGYHGVISGWQGTPWDHRGNIHGATIQ